MIQIAFTADNHVLSENSDIVDILLIIHTDNILRIIRILQIHRGLKNVLFNPYDFISVTSQTEEQSVLRQRFRVYNSCGKIGKESMCLPSFIIRNKNPCTAAIRQIRTRDIIPFGNVTQSVNLIGQKKRASPIEIQRTFALNHISVARMIRLNLAFRNAQIRFRMRCKIEIMQVTAFASVYETTLSVKCRTTINLIWMRKNEFLRFRINQIFRSFQPFDCNKAAPIRDLE